MHVGLSGMVNHKNKQSIQIAIAWCLAWGDGSEPQVGPLVLRQMHDAMTGAGTIPAEAQQYVDQAQKLAKIPYPKTLDELKAITDRHSELWASKIGLVYGGATKIKQYQ